MADAYDCILIGSGPGGYVAAIRAAQLGMKTAVIEKDDVVGGRCLNYACIPAKAVLRSADVLSEVRDADEFGISLNGADLTVDFAQVGNRRDKVIKTLTGGVSGLFKKNGIEVISGHGSVTEDGNVKVGGDFDGTEYEVRKAVILATGSVAKPIPGTEFGPRIIDTQGAWLLDELPDSIAVIGAGASGTEIASGYARLGVDVHLFEGLDRVLPLEDTDVSRVAERAFKKQGIKVHTSTLMQDVQAGERTVTFKYGDNQELTVEYLVIAAGRGPDIDGLGLDSAGIALDQNGQVEVDGAMRTSKEGVWAIGDLVHGPALAHKASDEGIIAVEDAGGIETHPIDYIDIPRATFCTPNVGSFGLTEQQARDEGRDVTVGKVSYGAVGAGAVYGDRSGMIKVVGDKQYGELLGGHIVGARATELVQELVNVKAIEGGYPEIARSIHGHPTLSEAVMEAARAADGWLIHG